MIKYFLFDPVTYQLIDEGDSDDWPNPDHVAVGVIGYSDCFAEPWGINRVCFEAPDNMWRDIKPEEVPNEIRAHILLLT